MTAIDRDQLAQETAEHIAEVLMPRSAQIHAQPGVEVRYVNDKRPPTDVDDIRAALLDGRIWLSWMDDKVNAAMRALHGPTA